MSILERWTKKATKTARETLKETSQEEMKEKMDILEGSIKIGALLFVGCMLLKGSGKHVVPDPTPVASPGLTIMNLYFGKEGSM